MEVTLRSRAICLELRQGPITLTKSGSSIHQRMLHVSLRSEQLDLYIYNL